MRIDCLSMHLLKNSNTRLTNGKYSNKLTLWDENLTPDSAPVLSCAADVGAVSRLLLLFHDKTLVQYLIAAEQIKKGKDYKNIATKTIVTRKSLSKYSESHAASTLSSDPPSTNLLGSVFCE